MEWREMHFMEQGELAGWRTFLNAKTEIHRYFGTLVGI